MGQVRSRRFARVVGALAVVLVVGGCGGGGGAPGDSGGGAEIVVLPPAEQDPATEEAVEEVVETPDPVVVMEPMVSRGVWHMANEAGYSYDLEIQLGQVMADPSLGHPLDSSFTSAVCGAEPTDAVIPAAMVVTATTADFPTEIDADLIVNRGEVRGEYTGAGVAPFAGDERVRVAQAFSTEQDCSTFSSSNIFGYGQAGGFGAKWGTPMAAGERGTHLFFVIVGDYFGPNTPEGDRALLEWIVLRPMFGGSNTDPAQMYLDTAGMGGFGFYSTSGITLTGVMELDAS